MILKTLEPKIQKAFLAAIHRSASAIDFGALRAALEAGDVERAVEICRFRQALLAPLNEEIRQSYVRGGEAVGGFIPQSIAGHFGFDGQHPRAINWMRNHGAVLIQGIEADGIEAVRNVVSDGIAQGRSHTSVARDITGRKVGRTRVGGFLGLTSKQTDSVILGRAKLASGDPVLMREYKNLKLRDRRFDSVIDAAIEAETPITGKQLDRIIEAHKSKALGYRGKVIAKNEAHTALMAGKGEAYDQLIDAGTVESVKKTWRHGFSNNPRDDHLNMGGKTIDFKEDFIMADGARMKHPHDPRGGAKHSIHCRCITTERAVISKDVAA